MREKFVVVVDAWDGPYDSFEAAEFCARDIILNRNWGNRNRKAVIAKVVDVVENNPPTWWDRAFNRNGAA